jgi:hypothetical protein
VKYQVYLQASPTNLAEPVMPGEYFETREQAQNAIPFWVAKHPEWKDKLFVNPPEEQN